MTHTYALLDRSPDAYRAIRRELEEGGWTIPADGTIDLHGLGIAKPPGRGLDPIEPEGIFVEAPPDPDEPALSDGSALQTRSGNFYTELRLRARPGKVLELETLQFVGEAVIDFHSVVIDAEGRLAWIHGDLDPPRVVWSSAYEVKGCSPCGVAILPARAIVKIGGEGARSRVASIEHSTVCAFEETLPLPMVAWGVRILAQDTTLGVVQIDLEAEDIEYSSTWADHLVRSDLPPTEAHDLVRELLGSDPGPTT